MGSQDDLATRLMDDMDPHLLAFIRERVNTFIKWDLVRFFHDNPHTADTAANIARYTGREEKAIESDLAELVASEVLQISHVAGQDVYTLHTDETTRTLIRRFVQACEDRQFRVKAIYHVIRGMG
jgi:hypothetical protein